MSAVHSEGGNGLDDDMKVKKSDTNSGDAVVKTVGKPPLLSTRTSPGECKLVPHKLMAKSLSTSSMDSTSSITSEEMNEPPIYIYAPWDVFGDAEEVGKVKLAKKGDKLPLEKWKKKKDGNIAVKFRVGGMLEVNIINKRDLNQTIADDLFTVPGSTSTPKKRLASPKSGDYNSEESKMEEAEAKRAEESPEKSRSGGTSLNMFDEEKSDDGLGEDISKTPPNKFASKQEWLSNLNSSFVDIVIGGLEVSLRDKVRHKFGSKIKLSPKENMAMVHSINHHIFKWIGNQRPESSLCRDIADIFKRHMPETYAYTDTVITDYGPMPVKRAKGEGGLESLAARIANNFYNRYVRIDILRPEVMNGPQLVDFSTKKQPRKFYGISPEKWNLAKKLSKKEYEKGAEAFAQLEIADSLEAMEEILQRSREFIQIFFRTVDPCTHIRKLSSFWKMPHGIKLLNMWFEWIVDGSKDGDLTKSIEDHMDAVMRMVENYLSQKKGESWIKKLAEVGNDSRLRFGNSLLLEIFLIRELAKFWGNKGEKLIFVDGQDDLKNMSTQPFVHAVKISQTGEGDFEDSFVFSVRIGSSLVFEGVSLTQGLAAIVQLSFVFNLLYPVPADDIFNFTQRVLACFGPVDCARNAKNQVKKNFVDFQCYMGNFMLQEKKAKLQKMFI